MSAGACSFRGAASQGAGGGEREARKAPGRGASGQRGLEGRDQLKVVRPEGPELAAVGPLSGSAGTIVRTFVQTLALSPEQIMEVCPAQPGLGDVS